MSSAPFYFDKNCLTDASIDTLPKKLEFSCDQDDRCFASDIFMNIVLNCAKPFGDSEIGPTTSIKLFSLSSQGLKKIASAPSAHG
jgi:hypothetical protein